MDQKELELILSWRGRRETIADLLTADRAGALAMTLDTKPDCFAVGDPLPPLWHWIYFWQPVPSLETGPDGHPKKGGFLPPVSLPNRMWAGGALEFIQPLKMGDRIEKISTIQDVELKEGQTGPLVFVTVRHDYTNNNNLLISELQNIVYRDASLPLKKSSTVLPEAWQTEDRWRQKIIPTCLLLFRYSALTFNGHRIHYDRDYVTNAEGYPGLVFHAPLIATLLAEQVRRNLPEKTLESFSYRASRPLFDTQAFNIEGRKSADNYLLRALDPQGHVATSAKAKVR